MMVKRFLIGLLVALCSSVMICAAQENVTLEVDSIVVAPATVDTLAVRLDSVAMALDSIPFKERWKKQIFRQGWNINDTSILYPKFIDFCFKIM